MTFSVGRRGRLLRSQLLTLFRTTKRENSLTWKTEGQKNTELPTIDLSLSVLGKNLVDPIKGQNPVPSHGLFPAAAPGVTHHLVGKENAGGYKYSRTTPTLLPDSPG